MLVVTNGNDFDLRDRFNGIDYDFPAGASVAIGEDAAAHIFGFGEGDKIPTLIRQGWMKVSNDEAAAREILNRFSFDIQPQVIPGEIVVRSEPAPPLEPSEIDSDDENSEIRQAIVQPATEKRTGNKKSIIDKLSGASA